MNTGIKALLLSLSLAGLGLSGSAHAAPSAGKVPTEQSSSGGLASDQRAAVSSVDKVNINTASADELARVMNGVGLKKAQAIVNHREEFGPFKSFDDLRQVPGMGGALVERNISHLML